MSRLFYTAILFLSVFIPLSLRGACLYSGSIEWWTQTGIIDGVRNTAPVVGLDARAFAARTESLLSAEVFPGFRAGFETFEATAFALYDDRSGAIMLSGSLNESGRRLYLAWAEGRYALSLRLSPGKFSDGLRRLDWEYRLPGILVRYRLEQGEFTGGFRMSYSNLLTEGIELSNSLQTHRLAFWLEPAWNLKLGVEAHFRVLDRGELPGKTAGFGYLSGIAADAEIRVESALPAGGGWLVQTASAVGPFAGQNQPFLSFISLLSNKAFVNAVLLEPFLGFGVAVSNLYGAGLSYRYLASDARQDLSVKPPQGNGLYSVNFSFQSPLRLHILDANWSSPEFSGFHARLSGGLVYCPVDDWKIYRGEGIIGYGTSATNDMGDLTGIRLWNAGLEIEYSAGAFVLGYSFQQWAPESLYRPAASGGTNISTNSGPVVPSGPADQFYGGGVHRLWCRVSCF